MAIAQKEKLIEIGNTQIITSSQMRENLKPEQRGCTVIYRF